MSGGPPKTAGAADEWRQGWRAVLATGIALAAGPAFYLYVSSLFVEPVEQAFSWSRSQMTAIAAIPLMGALVAPLVGWLVDRFGIYKVSIPSFILFGLAFFGLSQAKGYVWEVSGWMLLLGIAVPGATGLTLARPVVTWFSQSRGLALGVMAALVTVFTALLAPLLGKLIAAEGFRAGYMALGLLALCVGTPIVLFFIKEKADEKPDVTVPLPANTDETATPPGMIIASDRKEGIGTLLRQPRYWILLLAIILPNIPIGGIVTQLTPIIAARGIDAASAGFMLTLYALSAFSGRIVIGFLFDRYNAGLVAALICVVATFGAAMLHTQAPHSLLYLGVLTVGVMHGAEVDVGAFFTARMFPRHLFGSAMGGIASVGMIGTAIGVIGFGQMFDRMGGYDFAILLSSAMFLASALLFLALMGPMKRGHHVQIA